ncbi:MAG TPA: pyridoxamine 5'-phosphate oxidase family protein [Phycisphaerae bacterium]|nr:pyridoxamine 5'-phosphate oxidase family protein [Phycisphaerae bacterium]
MKRVFVDSRDEMEQILREEGLGLLGMTSDRGAYVVPLNYGYVDGRILFHCALEGRKLDCIRADPAVCFTVARQTGTVQPHFGTECHVDNDSVICLGRARIVEDPQEKAALLNAFNRCFRPDAADIPEERIRTCAVVEIRIEEMTGRREVNREVTCWRHRF